MSSRKAGFLYQNAHIFCEIVKKFSRSDDKIYKTAVQNADFVLEEIKSLANLGRLCYTEDE